MSSPDTPVWWAPHRRTWWIALLFSCGSLCFLVAPFPGFLQLVGSAADSAVFFAGSVFFTSAAALQYLETVRPRVFAIELHSADWWSSVVQLAGTIFFNVNTWDAMKTGLSTSAEDRLIWTPDVFGSACFLVASYIAFATVRGRRSRNGHSRDWKIAAVNLAGSVAFGLSAIASYVVPSTGDVLALGAANFNTALGAACFLAGALMLFPASAGAVHPIRTMPSRVPDGMVGK